MAEGLTISSTKGDTQKSSLGEEAVGSWMGAPQSARCMANRWKEVLRLLDRRPLEVGPTHWRDYWQQ